MSKRLLVGCLIGCLVVIAGCRPEPPPQQAKEKQAPPAAQTTPPANGVGQRAPDFTVTDVDGKVHSLKDYAGKVLVVDFWATYCKPCVEHLRDFSASQHELSRQGAEFLALSIVDSDAEMKGWRPEGFGIPLARLDDKTHEAFFANVQVVPIPQARVIDRKGILRYSFGPEATSQEIKQAVETLVAEK